MGRKEKSVELCELVRLREERVRILQCKYMNQMWYIMYVMYGCSVRKQVIQTVRAATTF